MPRYHSLLACVLAASLGANAGVRVAVGTDAGNPGRLHGSAIHRELALLKGC